MMVNESRGFVWIALSQKGKINKKNTQNGTSHKSSIMLIAGKGRVFVLYPEN
jgi:hypothetical protein